MSSTKTEITGGRGEGLGWVRSVVPNFLAPGTGFVEDNFSPDWGAMVGFGGWGLVVWG